MAKPTGTCAYCGAHGELVESHILPKWTIRRALEGPVTGRLRGSDNVNKRVQDGEKIYLLCSECEGKFSKLEGVASRAFDAGNVAHGSTYSKEFVLFLTSIVWRIGVVRVDEFRAAHPRLAPSVETALQTWKDVLAGKQTEFDGHPVWFAILDTDLAKKIHHFLQAESKDGRGASPAINRYFTNYIGTEMVAYESEACALIWGKTGSWLILGVATAPVDPAASSVEVSLSGGTFPAVGHQVPAVVLATLGYQSWHYIEKAGGISQPQRQKIKDDWTRKAAQVAGSDQARAIQADLDMFGDEALVNVPEVGE